MLRNAQVLADALMGYGYKLLTGGTDTHLIIWDLRPQNLKGTKLQAFGDIVGINLNSKYRLPRPCFGQHN